MIFRGHDFLSFLQSNASIFTVSVIILDSPNQLLILLQMFLSKTKQEKTDLILFGRDSAFPSKQTAGITFGVGLSVCPWLPALAHCRPGPHENNDGQIQAWTEY